MCAKRRLFLFLFLGLFLHSGRLEARIYVPIDQPADRKLPIAVSELANLGGGGRLSEEIPAIIRNNLEISAYFQVIAEDSFLDKNKNTITADAINFDLWTAIEVQALIKGGVRKSGGNLVVELRLFDPFLKQMLIGKEYRASLQNARSIAHRFSDEVMLALTGVKGPFNSKITYTAPAGKGRKAIYVMDYDGANTYRIGSDKSISLGSKFSSDGSKIVFTSYETGRPEIYLANLGGRIKRLTDNKATNITPAFTPDGSAVIFSSSMKGDPDIWLMTQNGRPISQLTNALGIDLAPVYSPDGGRILFASERAGNLHLFSMDAGGGGVSRLTFVGHYNDTPAWSPDGQKIAFCSKDAGNFDIFIMNSDGSFIQRLTAGQGSNTHPSWSPDSRYITFASTRSGEAVYVMRMDGANPTRVSQGGGLLPWWGPRLD